LFPEQSLSVVQLLEPPHVGVLEALDVVLLEEVVLVLFVVVVLLEEVVLVLFVVVVLLEEVVLVLFVVVVLLDEVMPVHEYNTPLTPQTPSLLHVSRQSLLALQHAPVGPLPFPVLE